MYMYSLNRNSAPTLNTVLANQKVCQLLEPKGTPWSLCLYFFNLLNFCPTFPHKCSGAAITWQLPEPLVLLWRRAACNRVVRSKQTLNPWVSQDWEQLSWQQTATSKGDSSQSAHFSCPNGQSSSPGPLRQERSDLPRPFFGPDLSVVGVLCACWLDVLVWMGLTWVAGGCSKGTIWSQKWYLMCGSSYCPIIAYSTRKSEMDSVAYPWFPTLLGHWE